MAQREGFLLIDHRASPGIPADVATQIGMDPKLVGEGRMLEAATLTCAHCKTVIVRNPYRTRERARCPKCSHKYLCDICAFHATLPDYNHKPFEAKVDEHFNMQAHSRLLLP